MRPRRRATPRAVKKPTANEPWARMLILFLAAGFLFWAVATRTDGAILRVLGIRKAAAAPPATFEVPPTPDPPTAPDTASTTAEESGSSSETGSSLAAESTTIERKTEELPSQAVISQPDVTVTEPSKTQETPPAPRRRRRRHPPRKWAPDNGTFPLLLTKPRRKVLNAPINSAGMKRVFIDAQRFGTEGDSVGIDPPLEATKGGVCPEFHYSYDTKRGIATCWHSRIEDEQQQMPSVPSTCKSGVMDKSCSLPDDLLPREPWAAQVLLLHNVYVNVAGQVFNRTHMFDDNSCAAAYPFSYPAGTKILRFSELVSVVDWFAWSSKAFLLELLPMFVSLDAVMPYLRGVPMAFGQRKSKEESGWQHAQTLGSQELLGVRLEKMNPFVLQEGDLFFAEKLFLPLRQRCGRPSKAMWTYIRNRHLLLKTGVPLYRHGAGMVSSYKKWKAEELSKLPGPDWVVVLASRAGRKPLVEVLKLRQQLLKWLPATRIVEYTEGTLSVSRRKDLLNRARLIVAVHGAALADMVFMPPGGVVFEIRPATGADALFHNLADDCGLHYYLTFAYGRRPTKLTVPDQKALNRKLARAVRKATANVQ